VGHHTQLLFFIDGGVSVPSAASFEHLCMEVIGILELGVGKSL
jgi:hypothetical protein